MALLFLMTMTIEFSNTVGFLNPPAEMLENICMYERRPHPCENAQQHLCEIMRSKM